jgi:hypothetical protein
MLLLWKDSLENAFEKGRRWTGARPPLLPGQGLVQASVSRFGWTVDLLPIKPRVNALLEPRLSSPVPQVLASFPVGHSASAHRDDTPPEKLTPTSSMPVGHSRLKGLHSNAHTISPYGVDTNEKAEICGSAKNTMAILNSKNLHNLHNLLNLIIFCRLLAGEVFGLRRPILHNVQHVHRGKLTDFGGGGLIELQTIAPF